MGGVGVIATYFLAAAAIATVTAKAAGNMGGAAKDAIFRRRVRDGVQRRDVA